MTTRKPYAPISRRTALAGLSAGGLGLGLAATARHAAAQDAAAGHPIVGVWNILALGAPGLANFRADGSVTFAVLPSYVDPALGVVFQCGAIGTWEPAGERGIHGTWISLLSDGDGASLGSVTFDGYPEVSADGRSFVDDHSRSTITIRDAAGGVVQQFPTAGSPPVIANRIEVGQPNFPSGAPAAATPTT